MFSTRNRLLDNLKQLYSKPLVSKPAPVETNYKDQVFIPYSRAASNIYSLTFAVSKDDYITERKKKSERRKKRPTKKAGEQISLCGMRYVFIDYIKFIYEATYVLSRLLVSFPS